MAPALEVADIFRRHGAAFRQAHAGHLGCVEQRIMSAITACRTAALGGHVEQCDDCGTHRVAIANSRLLSLADGKVRFTWKNYRQDGKTKVMTLEADEFIRRFVLHALPDGFHHIRHYGFLANSSRGDSLALCHRLLEARVTSAVREPADNHIQGDRPLTAADFAICPDCGGTMRRIAAVPRSCNAVPFSCDTS